MVEETQQTGVADMKLDNVFNLHPKTRYSQGGTNIGPYDIK